MYNVYYNYFFTLVMYYNGKKNCTNYNIKLNNIIKLKKCKKM